MHSAQRQKALSFGWGPSVLLDLHLPACPAPLYSTMAGTAVAFGSLTQTAELRPRQRASPQATQWSAARPTHEEAKPLNQQPRDRPETRNSV